MTRKRIDEHSTEFGLWLREQPEIDSGLGFVASNLDYIWRNYKTGDWMLIEEKRNGAKCPPWQLEMFAIVTRACRGYPGFKGFHMLVFEHTNPTDGRIWLDGAEVNGHALIAFLRFAGLP